MVRISTGIFYCTLLTPKGVLLECRAGSVILPGHDGHIGILRNHVPMLVKLGIGILQIKDILGRDNAYYIIDGGFARVSENQLTILAYDVITFEGMDRKEAEEMIAKAREVCVATAYVRHQTGIADLEKARHIVKLGRISSIFTED